VVFVETSGEWPAGNELPVRYVNGGGSHTFSARGIGSSAYEYRFKMYDGTAWTEVQPWSFNDSWTINNAPLGVYSIQVDVRGLGSVSNGDASATMAFRVAASPPTSVTLTTDKVSPQQAGTAITFTAQAQGTTLSTLFDYRFLLNKGGVATVVQDYSSANSWTLPANTPAGSYAVSVQARGANSAVEYDVYKTMDFQLTSVASTDLNVTSFSMPAEYVVADSATASWKLSDIGSTTYGSASAQTKGINSSGQIIGNDLTAFIWNANGRTDLAMQYAGGINEAGQVVGYTLGYHESNGFLYDKGTLTKLTPFTELSQRRCHCHQQQGADRRLLPGRHRHAGYQGHDLEQRRGERAARLFRQAGQRSRRGHQRQRRRGGLGPKLCGALERREDDRPVRLLRPDQASPSHPRPPQSRRLLEPCYRHQQRRPGGRRHQRSLQPYRNVDQWRAELPPRYRRHRGEPPHGDQQSGPGVGWRNFHLPPAAISSITRCSGTRAMIVSTT
jgi:probable HAF family extracellular repeat protein